MTDHSSRWRAILSVCAMSRHALAGMSNDVERLVTATPHTIDANGRSLVTALPQRSWPSREESLCASMCAVSECLFSARVPSPQSTAVTTGFTVAVLQLRVVHERVCLGLITGNTHETQTGLMKKRALSAEKFKDTRIRRKGNICRHSTTNRKC